MTRTMVDLKNGSTRYVLTEAEFRGKKYDIFHVYTIMAIYRDGQVNNWVYEDENLARRVFCTLAKAAMDSADEI